MKKAIILAAGQGSRMNKITSDLPKALIPFLGFPIISYQIRVLRQMGIEDIVIVRGYCSEKFNIDDVRYCNVLQNGNMVNSLFSAKLELNEEVLISYGDIIYSPIVLETIMKCKHDIAVAYDSQWQNLYTARFDNPYEDAESFVINNESRIINIGEKNPSLNTKGQFIGLLKLSVDGTQLFKYIYDELKGKYWNKLFIRNRKFQDIYTTDFLQALIDRGHQIYGCEIKKNWLEFDTSSDIKRYTDYYNSGMLSELIDIDQILNFSIKKNS